MPCLIFGLIFGLESFALLGGMARIFSMMGERLLGRTLGEFLATITFRLGPLFGLRLIFLVRGHKLR